MQIIGPCATAFSYTRTVTSCLGAIVTCSIYYVAVTCYFGVVLQNQNIKVISLLDVVLPPPLQNYMVMSLEGVQ